MSIRKSFWKTKTIEDQGKRQIKAIEKYETQLVQSNEFIEKDFNIDRDSIPLKEQKKIIELVEEIASELKHL